MAEELHTVYLDCCSRAQAFLFYGDGPLPFVQRHYIAIMAASVHSCNCLLQLHTSRFLLYGGDESWLNDDDDSVPQKLQNLREINEILANEPWLLTSSRISKLLQNPGIWSLSELMQAIVIMTHVHSLSGYFLAMESPVLKVQTGSDVLLSHPPSLGSCSSSDSDSIRCQDMTSSDIDSFCANSLSLLYEEDTENAIDTLSSSNVEIMNFLKTTNMTYREFRDRQSNHKGSSFYVNDYSWQDHGYPLANRLYTDVGIMLDEEFSTVQNHSATLSSEEGPNDALFMQAVWNYVFLLFGIQLDDYDHNEINQRLTRQAKAFVKLVACFPDRLNHQTFSHVIQDLNQCEMLHLMILVKEARFQVELLYSLHELSKT